MRKQVNFMLRTTTTTTTTATNCFQRRAAFGLTVAAMMLAASVAEAQPKDKLEIPGPEQLTLKTPDFVQLQCTFYPGGFKQNGDKVERVDGKVVAPVLLLHGWGQKRQDHSYLAQGLQRLGHAVLVPDMRGHGRSTKRVAGEREVELDYSRFRKPEIVGMAQDIVTCKRHLMKLNNQGKLNIEMLSIVAGDVMCITALNWVAYDWSLPQLPTMKQGRDVKAFVLLSPPMNFKGISITTALRNPMIAKELDGLVLVGSRDTKGVGDAKRIYDQLTRSRPQPPKDMFKVERDTNLRGIAMIPARGLNVGQIIAQFIDRRVVRNADKFQWRDRKSLLAN